MSENVCSFGLREPEQCSQAVQVVLILEMAVGASR